MSVLGKRHKSSKYRKNYSVEGDDDDDDTQKHKATGYIRHNNVEDDMKKQG